MYVTFDELERPGGLRIINFGGEESILGGCSCYRD